MALKSTKIEEFLCRKAKNGESKTSHKEFKKAHSRKLRRMMNSDLDYVPQYNRFGKIIPIY